MNFAFSQLNGLTKSEFLTILKERKEQVYVFGENHINNLPEIQIELIRFLHSAQGVRIIAYEAPLIYEDILNDYILDRKDKLFLLKDAFFSFKSFKIYIDSIKSLNVKLPSSQRLEFRCFESSGLNDDRFISLLNNQYSSQLISDTSDLLPFLKSKHPEKITKNYLDTMLSITKRESLISRKDIYFKIEKLIKEQIKSNEINSLNMKDWSKAREIALYNNILNIEKEYASFIITTGLYHANTKLNNHISFTSKMINEDKIDVLSVMFLTLSKSKKKSNFRIINPLLSDEIKKGSFKKETLKIVQKEDLSITNNIQTDFLFIWIKDNLSSNYFDKN